MYRKIRCDIDKESWIIFDIWGELKRRGDKGPCDATISMCVVGTGSGATNRVHCMQCMCLRCLRLHGASCNLYVYRVRTAMYMQWATYGPYVLYVASCLVYVRIRIPRRPPPGGHLHTQITTVAGWPSVCRSSVSGMYSSVAIYKVILKILES